MTTDDYNTARRAIFALWTDGDPQDKALCDFVRLTMERHNVHPAPWTMALLLNWHTALRFFTAQLGSGKAEDCMKLSKWLVDACGALQDCFARAGTPAPSGPAEIYRQLLSGGYRPPCILREPENPPTQEGNGESASAGSASGEMQPCT